MKTVLILSGGLDSTTLLYHLLAHGNEVKCLSFDYGQRHNRELESAKKIAADRGVEHKIVDLKAVTPLLAGSSQTDDSVDVPHGAYNDESMKLTVVPNRNMFMLSLGLSWAISLKFDQLAYAAHSGDHTIYPDCRPEFVHALRSAMALADWHTVKLIAPFVKMSRSEILGIGLKLKVPYEDTWTCYEGKDLACGKCGSCVERLETFQAHKMTDPIAYAEASA